MAIKDHDIYRNDLLEYLEGRGYPKDVAESWVFELMNTQNAVNLHTLLDSIFGAWESTQMQVPGVEIGVLFGKAVAEQARRLFETQISVGLGVRSLVLGTRVGGAEGAYVVMAQLMGANPGVKFPEKIQVKTGEGVFEVPLQIYWKSV